jgi:hypothetical protein
MRAKFQSEFFTTLNSIGISSSYRTLGRIVEQQASEVRKILKAISARGQAIQIERQDDTRVAVVQEDMEGNDWVPGDSRPDIEVHF